MSQSAAPAHTPVRSTPIPGLPPRYQGRELEYLKEALNRNNLFYWQQGGLVERALKRACQELGGKHAVATSSGTSALHVAVAAAGVEAGTEVITSPITDMGTAIAILYQNAIPVFADLDPRSFNMTAKTIEKAMTDRTRAVLLVHLTGSPADIDPIVDLCRRRNVTLIEDCAQAWGAMYKGKHVGTFGRFGCFSLNGYKHIACGDGGIVLTNDEAAYKAAHNFSDKFYDRHGSGNRLHGLGPNYRMTELQGAVTLAQFDDLWNITNKRNELGDYLTRSIANIPGILVPQFAPESKASYWFYMFRVDPAALGMSRDEFAKRLQAEGIPAGAGYIKNLLFAEPVFQNKNFFPGGVWPAEVVSGRKYDYRTTRCLDAQLITDTAVTLQIHQGMSRADIDDYITAIRR